MFHFNKETDGHPFILKAIRFLVKMKHKPYEAYNHNRNTSNNISCAALKGKWSLNGLTL